MNNGTQDRTYNGWSNYETWNVALWLSNDQGTYEHTREMADEFKGSAHICPQVRDGIWTEERAAQFLFADWLEEYVEEMSPDLGASMFADLLGAALSDVNWAEIAQNILSES